MIFVTAASRSFQSHYYRLKDSLTDHKLYTFDLGGLGTGVRFPVHSVRRLSGLYTPHSPFKPEIIRYASEMLVPDGSLFGWLDADTRLIRPVPELEDIPFDIAITWDGKYINAGVIFFRNTPQTRAFVQDWQRWTGTTKSDEIVLNSLFCLFDYDKLEIVRLENRIYNAPPQTPDAAIWHYEGEKARDLLI